LSIVVPTRSESTGNDLAAPSRPGILLDRDGTVIVDDGYVGAVPRVRFIEGAAEAIAAFNRAGVPVAIVSNQAGVARGYYGIEDVELVHEHIAERLAEHGAHVDLFLYCPYHPEGVVQAFARASEDRKPAPGMARAAARALNLDLRSSVVVGDRPEDIGLAAAIGARAIYVGPEPSATPGVRSFADLASATPYILDVVLGSAAEEPEPAFPIKPYVMPSTYCTDYFAETAKAAESIDAAQLERAVALLVDAYTRGATVFSCGNGGSAAIANHLQCDHLKGVRTDTDLTPRVTSLSSNIELITAVANDIGYEDVFAYQLQSQARPGDVVVAISSSGRSPNIVRALSWARSHEVATIALTGFDGGDARTIADAAVHVDSANYGVIEDLHQAVMHLMAQYIRQAHMPADAIAATRF
jgi:D-sedoheptulose 7-phosphate isomerase/D-glycero-D-manno-heptose 1,7-bisphosphate phosphatase